MSLVTIVAWVSTILPPALAHQGLIVPTHQGLVRGTFASPTVRAFLGVPYAVAGRWEDPRHLPYRRGAILNATDYGDACVQTLSPLNREKLKLWGLGDVDMKQSEDCLSVNVWTPTMDRKQGGAIIVFVHGGDFQYGTSNTAYYNGANLVRDNEDVVFVSFNYRLNIFGFPNAPYLYDKTNSQNFGLLDIKAAIHWVHDNISAFGGDPKRIILVGHDAGGGAVDAYSYVNRLDRFIEGLGQLSSKLPVSEYYKNGRVDPKLWNTIADAVGCGYDPSNEQVNCMKKVPFEKLETGVYATGGVAFNPLADDITIFSDREARALTGEFLHVPLFIGTTPRESDIDLVAYEEIVLRHHAPVLAETLANVNTLIQYICVASKATNARVSANIPTWRYLYEGVLPKISSRPDLRAYHGSDIPIFLGTYNATRGVTEGSCASDTTVALSKYMQGALLAFSRDPGRGLFDYGWPKYDSNALTLPLLGLAPDNETGVAWGKGSLLDFPCASMDALIDVQTRLNGIMEKWV